MTQTRERLGALSQEAERIASTDPLEEEAWKQVSAEWTSLVDRAEDLDPSIPQRFVDAQSKLEQHAAERRAAEERAVRQQVQRIEQLIERAQSRVAAEDLTLREADRIARDLRAAMDAPAPARSPVRCCAGDPSPLFHKSDRRHRGRSRRRGAPEAPRC
jgi:hypothetical protein